MFAKLPIVALAAISAVQGSPLNRRQATSAASSAVSSAASAASSAVESATSAASSAASSGASAASSGASSASSGASSAAMTSMAMNATSTASSSAAAATATGTTGNQSYPLYPCPTGFLLTYVEQNVTVDVPITQVGQAIGNWSTSPIFPNVTDAQGGTNIGDTHTLNLMGVNLTETLVNATTNSTSGYAMWNWNLTNGPVTAMNISVSNYSTVFSIYDPNFPSTGMIGNTTTAQIYVNFCASEQAAGMQLVGALTQAELAAFQAVAQAGMGGGNSTMPSSSMMSSSMPMSSSAASSAESATSAASSGASSATSAAASGATSAASGASSGAAAATSAVASAVSGATSAAASAATSG